MPFDVIEYTKDRFILLKVRAIKYKGGKCYDCGYDKCYAALEFHHRNKDTKDVDWMRLRRRSWTRIVLELDKCDLLCANCHRERHHDERHLIEAQQRAKAREKTRAGHKFAKRCKYKLCAKVFMTPDDDRMYCTHRCATTDQVKITWPNNLPDLVAKGSMRSVAAMLGVSDKAIAKRLKRHHDESVV